MYSCRFEAKSIISYGGNSSILAIEAIEIHLYVLYAWLRRRISGLVRFFYIDMT
jgi:hypothetical protein